MTPPLAAAGLRFKGALKYLEARHPLCKAGRRTYKKDRAKPGCLGGGEDLRILFITSTRVGDAILSTGLLAHLIERHPDARVTIACGPAAAPLFDAVPNLVATKTTSGGLEGAADLMKHSSELQHFFGERNFPHGAMLGECSLLASWAPASPHKTRELFDAGRRGDWGRLFDLQQAFHAMTVDVLGQVRDDEHIDGAYDKMLVRLGGMEEMPLRLLSPYQGFTEEQYQQCKAVLHERYPDWVARE